MSSGAMIAHAQHLAIVNANAWYPLVFMLARRGLLENKLFWTLGAGCFFGIENLTGHFQHAVFLGLLLFLYFAYEACAGPLRSKLWPRWIYQLTLIAAVGAGLAMIQILPTAELNPLSIRTKVTAWQARSGWCACLTLSRRIRNFASKISTRRQTGSLLTLRRIRTAIS